MTNTYSYIDKAGTNQFTTADTPEQAIATAPNRMATSGVQLEPATKAIGTDTLATKTPAINLPAGNTYDPATGMYSSGASTAIPQAGSNTTNATNTANTTTATNTTNNTNTTTPTNDLSSLLTQYLGNAPAVPSLTDSYAQAQNDAGIADKTKAVNDATASLNDINQRASASSLSQGLRSKDNVSGAISGAQGDIQRKAAIEALPVKAQLDAAQGNLDSANKNLETMFKLKSEDATNQYNAMKDQRDAVYKFATDAQKAQIDAQNKIDDRNYQVTKDLNNYKQSIAQELIKNGQGNLIGGITNAKTTDEVNAILNKAPISEMDKLKVQNQVLQNRKLQYDVDHPTSGTASERATAASANFSNAFVYGAKLPDGTGIIGSDGYVNLIAWKQAIADAPKEGITRADFIKQFGYLLNPTNTDYGITPVEQKLINGVL